MSISVNTRYYYCTTLGLRQSVTIIVSILFTIRPTVSEGPFCRTLHALNSEYTCLKARSLVLLKSHYARPPVGRLWLYWEEGLIEKRNL